MEAAEISNHPTKRLQKPQNKMFLLKLLKNITFYAILCTFIWFVCNLTVPLHPKNQNS